MNEDIKARILEAKAPEGGNNITAQASHIRLATKTTSAQALTLIKTTQEVKGYKLASTP